MPARPGLLGHVRKPFIRLVVLAHQLLKEPAPAYVNVIGQPCQQLEHLVVHGERSARALAFGLNWLKGQKNDLVAAGVLNGWIDDQPVGPWIELLREGIDENVLETGGDETPVDNHFVEWLAEWGREVHRKQRGLLLLTAHRAKGLEFDHVVVLDRRVEPCWPDRGH